MDVKTRQSQNSEQYNGYESYSEDKEKLERTLNRDLKLMEYDEDKDAIIGAIKQALKDRDYETAQEFVHQFRAAAKTDENFEVLARMTAEGIKNKKEVDRIQTVIDATPEDDYEVRLSLCEKKYKLISSEENLNQVNEYRKILNKPILERAVAEKSTSLPAPIVNEARVASSVLAKGTCAAAGVVAPLLVMFFMLGGANPASIVPLICAGIYNWVSFASLKQKEHTTGDAIKKMILNTAAMILSFIVAFVVAMLLKQ